MISPKEDRATDSEATDAGDEAAERGVASMARTRSLQSRLSSVLAMLLCGGLGVGLLIWYYGAMVAHRSAAPADRHGPTPAAVSESSLPPLGPVRDPGPPSPPVSSAAVAPLPVDIPSPPPAVLDAVSSLAPAGSGGQQTSPTPATIQTAVDRRLTGPAFAGNSGQPVRAAEPGSGAAGVTITGQPPDSADRSTDHSSALAGLLTPTAMPAVQARNLPTQRLLLAKGAFIDCTLETAIDSSLPGMTTCITATDTFSVDGKVVLLERGSKLIGETRGQVQQGSARLFVLWTEARTPTGVVVPLASPGTDALGRSGLDGEVDRHFWQRFGAAILISVVDAGAQAAQRSGGSGSVIYDTSASQNVATEALRGTIGIAPIITKHQGDRIQILVARDLDFRQVYQLRDFGQLGVPGAYHQQ